jgi:PPOX class probable F420-dependent enzyme
MVVDPSTPDGAHADERLRSEPIIWLATVRPDGQAQTTPVWFLWDGTSILIYSKPDAAKVRNVKANPHVALNLDGDGTGGNIVTLEGSAEHLPFATPATEVEPYLEKYRELIARLGSEPEPFAQIYSAALRVTPTRLRVY